MGYYVKFLSKILIEKVIMRSTGKKGGQDRQELQQVEQMLPRHHDVTRKPLQSKVEGNNNPYTYLFYKETVGEVNRAIEALGRDRDQGLRYDPSELEANSKYCGKLNSLVEVCGNYANALGLVHNEFEHTFCKNNHVFLKEILNKMLIFLKKDKNKSRLFTSHINSIDEIFANYGVAEDLKIFVKKIPDIMETVGINGQEDQRERTLSTIRNAGIKIADIDKFVKLLDNISELIEIKVAESADIQSVLSKVEDVFITLKRSMLMLATENAVTSYLQMNRDIIGVQLKLLDCLSKSLDPTIKIWPSFTRELGRVQVRDCSSKPLPASVFTLSKSKELQIFEGLSVAGLLPIIDIVVKVERLYDRLKARRADIGEDEVIGLLKDKSVKKNALLKLFVLTNIIKYYANQNPLKTTLNAEEVVNLQSNIAIQMKYLQHIVNNLESLRLVWGGKVFQFLNTFLFPQQYLQEVIGVTELARLHCEVIFRHMGQSDRESKEQTIARQIKLLKTQNTLLSFVDKDEEKFVRNFYLKIMNGRLISQYDAIGQNRTIEKVDRLHVIDGIPIKMIIERNLQMGLELESILLATACGQQSSDSDYLHIISNRELEKYLRQWDQKAKEEEKQHKAAPEPKKSHRSRRQKGKVAGKATVECREGDAPVLKAAPEPLVIKRRELQLELNNHANFSSDKVVLIIHALSLLIKDSGNEQLKFEAFAAIGDGYRMITNYCSNKEPTHIVANIKIALNYYRQAEMTLKKLNALLSQEECDTYKSFLKHSISKQEQLLKDQTQIFSKEYDDSLKDKAKFLQDKPERCEKWVENHKDRNWKPSRFSLRRRELRKAICELGKEQKKVRELADSIDNEIKSKAETHKVYTVEQRRLDVKPTRQLPGNFQENKQPEEDYAPYEREVVFSPQNQHVLHIHSSAPMPDMIMVPALSNAPPPIMIQVHPMPELVLQAEHHALLSMVMPTPGAYPMSVMPVVPPPMMRFEPAAPSSMPRTAAYISPSLATDALIPNLLITEEIASVMHRRLLYCLRNENRVGCGEKMVISYNSR